MKLFSRITIFVFVLLMASTTFANRNSYNLGYQLGKAVGMGYGTLVMVTTLQRECAKTNLNAGRQIQASIIRWYGRNKFYVVRSRLILKDVLTVFQSRLSQSRSAAERQKITRSIAIFGNLGKTMQKRAHQLYYSRPIEKRMSMCQQMARKLDSGMLDVARRSPAVAQYLRGWDKYRFASSLRRF